MRWHRIAFVSVPAFASLAAETPYSRQTPSIGTLDLRVEKTFQPHSPGQMFGLYLDVLNATNLGQALAFVRFSGPQFGVPAQWTEPRTIRIGIRYTF